MLQLTLVCKIELGTIVLKVVIHLVLHTIMIRIVLSGEHCWFSIFNLSFDSKDGTITISINLENLV